MEDSKLVKTPDAEKTDIDKSQPELLEELSIFELDERLEFVAWCDNCNCTGDPK